MKKNDIKMAACIVIAIIAIMTATIWVHAVNKLNAVYQERIAHQQMQIDSYKELMAERDKVINDLKKEIAAQPDKRE